MNQLNMLDAPPIDTRRYAREAAAAVAGQQTRDVLDYLRSKGRHGATDQEISRDLQIRLDSARARRCELRDQGRAVDSGHRRATDSGRPAIVWTLPAFAPGAETGQAADTAGFRRRRRQR